MADLSRDVFAVFGDYETTLPRYLRMPGVETLICHHRGQPAGFLMLALLLSDDNRSAPDHAEILAIAVDPSHQGRGLGKAMLRHARRWAQTCGWPVATLQLNVAHTNQRAFALFEAFGFWVMEPNDGTYDGGQRSIRMALDL